MKRISISKYLNSIYNFYYNKTEFIYQPIFKKKDFIDLNDDLIEILEKKIFFY